MRLQKINYAEAIIEPFFDGSDSDRPSNKISQLEHYTVACSDPLDACVRQIWCGVQVVMNGGRPAWLEMTRSCDLNIAGFDIFRVFSSMPGAMRQTIRAEIDGEWVDLCSGVTGTDNTDEYDFPIAGQHMTGLSIRLEQDGQKDGACLFEWLGLSNAEREEQMLSQRSVFPADWPDMLNPDGGFEPEIGIWFDSDELTAIRKRLHEGVLAPIYEKMRAHAEANLNWEPEKDIGEYIPHPDRRWVRTRDRDKRDTSYAMQELAFVGLIEKDARMMKLAVRMALSAAHCARWNESIMGSLPGCAWHHRSFTEEVYCRGCALVLDWAGSWLTSYGRMAIVDAIVMKGLPRLESDYKRQEYIRGMNQGIVFSSGRIFGLLACRHFFPRYDSMVLEAERDLNEMIAQYILPDGGSPEGPAYWAYTFSQAMPILYVLSRFHGHPFREALTPALEKTGLHALSLLSVTGRGNLSIPVNDAHSGTEARGGAYPMSLLAALYSLTGNEAYARLMSVGLKADDVQPSLELFIMAPNRLPQVETFVQQGFTCLPDLGQVRIIRPDECFGRVGLSFFTGLADVGHYHMDKGSFILETEQETLLIDRGVLSYEHPDMLLLQMPEYHNLLYPELSGARVRQKPTRNGAFLEYARFDGGLFEARGDVTRAWDDQRVLRDVRVIRSDDPGCYLIQDELNVAEEAPAAFLLHTRCACEPIENGVVVHGKGCDVYIEAVNWRPADIVCERFGLDEHQESVNRIVLRTAPAREHRLETRISLRR